MTRRLESSARDYAIACLARGMPPESMPQLADEYSRAVQEVADEERARRRDYAPLPGAFADRVVISRNCTAYARRLVRARVALYLRTLRRAEAWERGGRYTFTHWSSFKRRHANGEDVFCVEAVRSSTGDRVVSVALLQATPWRPLWTSAPPHEPGVTARMRREVKR